MHRAGRFERVLPGLSLSMLSSLLLHRSTTALIYQLFNYSSTPVQEPGSIDACVETHHETNQNLLPLESPSNDRLTDRISILTLKESDESGLVGVVKMESMFGAIVEALNDCPGSRRCIAC
jgi:hypothetical protein